MAKVGLEQIRKVYPEGSHVAVAGATFDIDAGRLVGRSTVGICFLIILLQENYHSQIIQIL